MKIRSIIVRGMAITACAGLALFVNASQVQAQEPDVLIISPEQGALFEEVYSASVSVVLVARANVGELAYVNVKIDEDPIIQALPEGWSNNGWESYSVKCDDLERGLHTVKVFPVDTQGGFGFGRVDFEVSTTIPMIFPPKLEMVSPNNGAILDASDLVKIHFGARTQDGIRELKYLNIKMEGPMEFDKWYHPEGLYHAAVIGVDDRANYGIKFDTRFVPGTYTATIYATDYHDQTSYESVTFTVRAQQ